MFFTAEGLEQSTGDAIARYRAGRFPAGVGILDACCGIGGDARALAERGPVLAVDVNPAAAVCILGNMRASAAESPYPVHALCGDVTALDLQRLRRSGIEAALFDPSRRGNSRDGGRRRIRESEDYAPPLSWLENLRDAFPTCAVKVSPALEDSVLHRYGAGVEFISDRGECKEAVLWFGSLTTSAPIPGTASATVLRPDCRPHTLESGAMPLRPATPPGDWLYEPDPAVIRAHLVGEIAEQLSASPLERGIAYLTAASFVPTPFATAYRVLDWMPYNLKNLQARLRSLHRRVSAIKKRGVPMEPEDLRKRLMGDEAGDAEAVVVLTRRGDKPIAMICEAPTSAG